MIDGRKVETMVEIKLRRAENDFTLHGLPVHAGDLYGTLNDNNGNDFHCYIKPYNNEFSSDDGEDTILDTIVLDAKGWRNHWLKESDISINVSGNEKIPETFMEKLSVPHFLGGFSAPEKEALKKSCTESCGKVLYNKNFATGTIVVKA